MFNFPLVPEQASTHAGQYDALFFVLVALTVFFTVVVGALVVLFAIRYRQGTNANRQNAPHENLKLEIAWSVIPMFLALGVFAWGAQQFVVTRTPPKNAMDVFVIGKQWMWHLQHSNGVRENNELHVPVGMPVRLTMISQDAIHAFYIPEFRIQYHVVPGRYTSTWFTASKPGKYRLFCSMYCGTQHSEMGGYVYVMDQKDFATWLANGGNRFQPVAQTMAEEGKQLYDNLACANCHLGSDTLRAPTLYGIFGKARKMKDGSTVVADEAYLRESILKPYDKLTAGYEKAMPEYQNALSEQQVLELIAYMKSLGAPMSPSPQADTPTNANTNIETAPKADAKR